MAACSLLGQANAGKAQSGGQRLLNPASPAARLMLATPEQRERLLTRFAPQRQAQIRQQLAWFDSLPRAQQEVQIRRLERFAALAPAERAVARQQMQALNRLPLDRRQAVRRALANLANLAPNLRARRMNNPAFRARFSPEELKIMQDLAKAWLPGPI